MAPKPRSAWIPWLKILQGYDVSDAILHVLKLAREVHPEYERLVALILVVAKLHPSRGIYRGQGPNASCILHTYCKDCALNDADTETCLCGSCDRGDSFDKAWEVYTDAYLKWATLAPTLGLEKKDWAC